MLSACSVSVEGINLAERKVKELIYLLGETYARYKGALVKGQGRNKLSFFLISYLLRNNKKLLCERG